LFPNVGNRTLLALLALLTRAASALPMRRVIAAKERGVPAKRPSAVNDAAIAPRGRRDADDDGPSAHLRNDALVGAEHSAPGLASLAGTRPPQ
jgi:hypothetical protein